MLVFMVPPVVVLVRDAFFVIRRLLRIVLRSVPVVPFISLMRSVLEPIVPEFIVPLVVLFMVPLLMVPLVVVPLLMVPVVPVVPVWGMVVVLEPGVV